MPSVSEAVDQLEQSLFVGRQHELELFREWLLAKSPFSSVLSITGPGGVGKSTLLRTFERVARTFGKPVTYIDGRDFPPTPEALLSALSGCASAGLQEAVERINQSGPLLLVDTFEEIDVLSDFLFGELVPRLDTEVRIAVAGRRRLNRTGSRGDAWLKMIRPLPLEGLSSRDVREYLARRGLTEPELARKVSNAAGGNPLALCLAADMAQQFGVRDFAAAPRWRLVVRSLGERLLRDVKEPELRELLEACAVIHQFDEATLAAISGREDVAGAFDHLCRLSIVKPADHGLQLHDDVRRQLAADLSWRQSPRYNLLRQRALAYYRERLRAASDREREWLAAETFFLWTNALLQQVFFSPSEPGEVLVDMRQESDDDPIRQLYAGRIDAIYASELGGTATPPADDNEFLEAILSYGGSRVRVARNEAGDVLGFSGVVPVCQESLAVLRLNAGIDSLLRAPWQERGPRTLPATAEGTRSFSLCMVVHGDQMAGPVRAALLRDFTGLFARSGTYLCATALPSYKALLEAAGFRPVPGAQTSGWGPGHLIDGYVLDLSEIGFERWIEAMVNGQKLNRPPDLATVEKDIQLVLQHWDDGDWLATSPLLTLQLPHNSQSGRASIRDVIIEAIDRAEGGASPELALAYRALRLAYMSDGIYPKQAVKNLAVSRATFYRLVRRGVRGLAEGLRQQCMVAWRDPTS